MDKEYLQGNTGILWATASIEHEIYRTLAISAIFMFDIEYHWNSWIALPGWHGNMNTISVVGLECVLSKAVGGCWNSKLKIIFISQIVASNRPGGQRSGPGGWLLLSWWVWRILPSSIQVSISPSLSLTTGLAELLNWRPEKPGSVLCCVLVGIFDIK